MKAGWHNESKRHSLAREGIKTGRKITKFPGVSFPRKPGAATLALQDYVTDVVDKLGADGEDIFFSHERTKIEFGWADSNSGTVVILTAEQLPDKTDIWAVGEAWYNADDGVYPMEIRFKDENGTMVRIKNLIDEMTEK